MNFINNRLSIATSNLRYYSTSIAKLHHRTRRGTKAGRNVFRPIRSITTTQRPSVPVRISCVDRTNLVHIAINKNVPDTFSAIESLVRSRENAKSENKCNSSNLSKIKTSSNDGSNTALSLVTLNTRSVKNKTTSVCDFLTSNNVDIFALTETWLGSSVDKHIISEITPDGYDLHHVARTSRKGGGVAIIFNKSLEVKPVSSKHSFSHFELLECNVSSKHHRFRLCVIYRPPPSRINKLKTSTFFEEWSTFL